MADPTGVNVKFRRGVIVRHKADSMNMLVLRSSGQKTTVAYCETNSGGTLRICTLDSSDLREVVGLGESDAGVVVNEKWDDVSGDGKSCEPEPHKTVQATLNQKELNELADYFARIRAEKESGQ
jgi:hypothetical protein